jgi:hypothetical protein
MADDRCKDCDRHIRLARVHGWSNNPGGVQVPFDYAPSPQGEYAMVGPETAVYRKQEERLDLGVPLYTDHRRTCTAAKTTDDPMRPLFPKIRMICDECQAEKQLVDDESAHQLADKFISEHAGCRRKAS